MKRGNQEEAGQRSGLGKLPMPGSWGMGTAGKDTTTFCMAQNGPGASWGVTPPEKATGP